MINGVEWWSKELKCVLDFKASSINTGVGSSRSYSLKKLSGNLSGRSYLATSVQFRNQLYSLVIELFPELTSHRKVNKLCQSFWQFEVILLALEGVTGIV